MSHLGESLALLELDGRGPRYEQITRALLEAFTAGAFSSGARLPPDTRDAN